MSEQSVCPRNQWYSKKGKELRSQGWALCKSGPKWDSENALIERVTKDESDELRELREECERLRKDKEIFRRVMLRKVVRAVIQQCETQEFLDEISAALQPSARSTIYETAPNRPSDLPAS